MPASPTAFRGPLARALGDDVISRLADPDLALPIGAVFDPETVADVSARAAADLGAPWPQPLASAAARFHGDGDRVSWETPAFARAERLSRAALMAAATGEDRWLDEAVDGAILLCEQSSWCWPAHDHTRQRHGSVLATVTDPCVDLGAGEAVAQLAWLDALLGDALDARYPGVRERIRHEAQVRVFEPFVRRRDWHWIGLDGPVHNWNPWIHGNVLVAALRLLPAGDPRDLVIGLCIEGLDRYVAALPEDGAIDEGYAYWWNGACRLLEALDVLTSATGVDPVPLVRALRETVAFPHRMHLGRGWYVNVADGPAKPSPVQPWHALFRAARRAGDARAEAHARAHRAGPAAHEAEGLGRLVRGATDPDWLRAAPGDDVPERRADAIHLPSTQMLVARGPLTLVAKGGHNGENHNHNDVGSVIVASDGVPVVVDAGRPTYTAQTFRPARYDIWTMQSQWHSTPFVRGAGQRAGAAFGALSVHASTGSGLSRITMDLAPAYGDPALRSWRRTASLEAGRILLADAWDLDEWTGSDPEPRTEIRFLIAGDIELAPGRARVTPREGATPVVLEWDPEVAASTVARELDDPWLTEVWGARLMRLDLDVRGRSSLDVSITQEER